MQISVDDRIIDTLVKRIAGRDAGSLVALHHLFSHHLLTEIRQHLSDPAACQAVLQSTFIEIWRLARRDRITPGEASQWICGIANRRATERTQLARASVEWHTGALLGFSDVLNRIELAEIFTAANNWRLTPKNNNR